MNRILFGVAWLVVFVLPIILFLLGLGWWAVGGFLVLAGLLFIDELINGAKRRALWRHPTD